MCFVNGSLFVWIVVFLPLNVFIYRSRFFYLNFAVFIVQFSKSDWFATYSLLVGSSGLEPPTLRLSGVRSNHLSYEPISLEWLSVLFPQPVVEMRRIELLTPCVQGRCSPSWATPPYQGFGYAALTAFEDPLDLQNWTTCKFLIKFWPDKTVLLNSSP